MNINNTTLNSQISIKIQPAKNKLLNGWSWICYNDGSGHLQSPAGKSYFHYDWATTEYRTTDESPYSLWGTRNDDGIPITFEDFQSYAEKYVVEHYLETNCLEVSENDKQER